MIPQLVTEISAAVVGSLTSWWLSLTGRSRVSNGSESEEHVTEEVMEQTITQTVTTRRVVKKGKGTRVGSC